MRHQKPELAKDDDHDEIQELKRWKAKKEITDGVNARVRAICITGTTAVLGWCFWVGGKIYDNFSAVEAGIRAYFAAMGNRHD
jgi:hypothetical protein